MCCLVVTEIRMVGAIHFKTKLRMSIISRNSNGTYLTEDGVPQALSGNYSFPKERLDIYG
jgi:hypothetical protein